MKLSEKHTAAYFKEIVVSNAHDLFAPVHDNRSFLNNAPRANHDRACNCKDCSFWMHNGSFRRNISHLKPSCKTVTRTCTDGYVSLELDILAHNGFGVNRKFVAANDVVILIGEIFDNLRTCIGGMRVRSKSWRVLRMRKNNASLIKTRQRQFRIRAT